MVDRDEGFCEIYENTDCIVPFTQKAVNSIGKLN